jgi:hypothetical protein
MRLLCFALVLVCTSCGPGLNLPPGSFGEVTSAVVIVNPRINQGSSTTVTSGTQRSAVVIKPGSLAPVTTDSTGLALVQGFPTGTLPLELDTGTVNLTVSADKELYDVVVAYKPGGVETVVPAVRYPIGGQVKVVEPGGDIAAAAASDGTIVVLRAGTYPGNLELTAAGVLIFGDWTLEEGQRSIIEGNVNVRGGNIRMRGVKVTGTLTSSANGFSAAFSDLAGANLTGNGISLIRNRFTSGAAKVPSSNAVLVDNEGIP